MYYSITVLDAEGCDLSTNHDVRGLALAKTTARNMLAENAADAHKVEVRNDKGECVWCELKPTTAPFNTAWVYLKRIEHKGKPYHLWSCQHREGYTAYQLTHDRNYGPTGPSHYTSLQGLTRITGIQIRKV